MAVSKKKAVRKQVVAKVAEPTIDANQMVQFVNMTKRNIFTTLGRVGSHETISIPFVEGERTKGLDRV